MRVRGGTPEVVDEARRRFLAPLLAHLTEAGIGHISEIADGTGAVTCYFFGQPWLARAMVPGTSVVVSGEMDSTGRMANPLFDRYLTSTRQRIGMTVVHDEEAEELDV